MNPLENIEKLKTLLDSGAINEEEYEEMKKKAVALFGKGDEPSKEVLPKTESFISKKYETIHLAGICILVFTTLLSSIANLIGLINIHGQAIMDFMCGVVSLLYVPCGIIYGVYQKNWKSWLIVITLFLILLCSLFLGVFCFVNIF